MPPIPSDMMKLLVEKGRPSRTEYTCGQPAGAIKSAASQPIAGLESRAHLVGSDSRAGCRSGTPRPVGPHRDSGGCLGTRHPGMRINSWRYFEDSGSRQVHCLPIRRAGTVPSPSSVRWLPQSRSCQPPLRSEPSNSSGAVSTVFRNCSMMRLRCSRTEFSALCLSSLAIASRIA